VRAADALPVEVTGGDDDPGQWSFIAIGEGRHHEVRRLYGTIGHPVLRLVRLAFGSVTLGDLVAGSLREVRADERAALEALVATSSRSRPT
jgi:23S rRNA pseudouridine2605 synthase